MIFKTRETAYMLRTVADTVNSEPKGGPARGCRSFRFKILRFGVRIGSRPETERKVNAY